MDPIRVALILGVFVDAASAVTDWRSLPAGAPMLEDAYLDQPQCAVWGPSGRWVCTIARNSQPEGHYGEHSEILYSDDRGNSWTTGIRLEANTTPTNSYGNILQTHFGRLYVVYNMNLNNVTHFPDGTPFSRDDELGFFVARYSDDGGETWSAERLTLPQRVTSVDRTNSFNGSTLMFWSVDQVKLTRDGATIQAYTKIGKYVQSAPEQSFFITSPNVMTEANASAVTWEIFPDGDTGVAAPAPGLQWEEAHVLPLEASSGLFSITRTSIGYLGAALTPDGAGRSGWVLAPSGGFMTFSAAGGLAGAAGRRVKNPEGPITLKRFPVAGGGKCLLLFYFNSCPGYACPGVPRSARNPYFLAAGWEEEGEVRISQPEVVLYDLGLLASGTAAGYPDFIETSDGGVWVTETNKTHARSHRLDGAFLATLFSADTLNATATGNVSLTWSGASQGASFLTPPLPDFTPPLSSPLDGLTIALWLSDHTAALPGQALIDLSPSLYLGVAGAGPGVPAGALEVRVTDSKGLSANLTLDADCSARLVTGSSAHYVAVTVDTGAHILSASVDGVVCDGGAAEAYGWSWVPPAMGNLNCPSVPQSFLLGAAYGGRIGGGTWYSRRLLNTEVVGNYRHQLPAAERCQ
jgi:hypothetical protein